MIFPLSLSQGYNPSLMKKPSLLWILGVLLILMPACSQKPQVEWTPYTPEKMQQVMASGQPVFAYFYAAWCRPCVMLREHTFNDSRVIAALEPYHRIKFDMSFIHSPKIQKISEEYQVAGMPSLILFAPDGKSFHRHSGFISAEQLLKILKEFRTKYGLPEPEGMTKPQ